MNLFPGSPNSKQSSSSKRKMSSSHSGRKIRRKSKSSVHRSKGANRNLDKTQITEKIDYFYSPYAKSNNEESKGYMTFGSPKVSNILQNMFIFTILPRIGWSSTETGNLEPDFINNPREIMRKTSAIR